MDTGTRAGLAGCWLLSVAAAGWAHAAAESPARPPLVIKATHLFDSVSGNLSEHGVVVVEGGKIKAMGGEAQLPPDAQVIDLGDATLLPGFIDAHTHLSDPYHADYRQGEMDLLKKAPAERALIASEIVRITLMAGFTTVRDVGSEDLIDVGLRNAIDAGKIPGPRMLVSVRALGSTGGHCDPAAGFIPNLFDTKRASPMG